MEGQETFKEHSADRQRWYIRLTVHLHSPPPTCQHFCCNFSKKKGANFVEISWKTLDPKSHILKQGMPVSHQTYKHTLTHQIPHPFVAGKTCDWFQRRSWRHDWNRSVDIVSAAHVSAHFGSHKVYLWRGRAAATVNESRVQQIQLSFCSVWW